MSSRPITSRLFASTCPTCRIQGRRTISIQRAIYPNKTADQLWIPSRRRISPNSTPTSRWLQPVRTERTALSHLARSYATASGSPAGSTPLRVIPPTPESLKTSEEFEDAELVPEAEAKLNVTEDAVRVSFDILSHPSNRELRGSFLKLWQCTATSEDSIKRTGQQDSGIEIGGGKRRMSRLSVQDGSG